MSAAGEELQESQRRGAGDAEVLLHESTGQHRRVEEHVDERQGVRLRDPLPVVLAQLHQAPGSLHGVTGLVGDGAAEEPDPRVEVSALVDGLQVPEAVEKRVDRLELVVHQCASGQHGPLRRAIVDEALPFVERRAQSVGRNRT